MLRNQEDQRQGNKPELRMREKAQMLVMKERPHSCVGYQSRKKGVAQRTLGSSQVRIEQSQQKPERRIAAEMRLHPAQMRDEGMKRGKPLRCKTLDRSGRLDPENNQRNERQKYAGALERLRQHR